MNAHHLWFRHRSMSGRRLRPLDDGDRQVIIKLTTFAKCFHISQQLVHTFGCIAVAVSLSRLDESLLTVFLTLRVPTLKDTVGIADKPTAAGKWLRVHSALGES